MDYRTVVIGGGPGGYVAAIRLGQLKQKTLLVERDRVGGVCLQRGCIPSKALIQAAKTYHTILHQAPRYGIHAVDVMVRWAETVQWKRQVVDRLTRGIHQLLKGSGVEYVQGEATLVGPHQVRIQTADGVRDVTAETVVIATGSEPVGLPGFEFDGEHIISSTEALELETVPGRLAVIGGGYIGLELGMAYAMVGSQVTIVEIMDQLLPGTSPDLVKVVERRLRRLNVQTLTSARAKDIERTGDAWSLVVESQGQTQKIPFDRLLVTVGRKPLGYHLGLETLGVQRDEKGYVRVDDRRRTTVPHIFAIGDVAGAPLLAHKASHEGEVVAEVIAGRPVAVDYKAVPAVIFTDPEIATVGLTEVQAQAQGVSYRVGRFPFAALGRAQILQETDGFVKVIAEAGTGLVLGVEIVGPEASTLIAEAALAVEMGAHVEDIALTVHAHPTLPEALMEAAKAVFGQAIHVLQ
ncbi:MAG: dihydrolipoyl dehydrogenase [Acidobacteria bacterium]|nr:dihydrolipoyl dehydrogenase [Acidobacteriota bacterium]MDW7983205.1 dihydrolipoyl dehydrogenase [Acidobacteriota bacterium]